MRDPHVTSLIYVVGSGENISYDNPPLLRFTNHLGCFVLFKGLLSIKPQEHFSSEGEALQAVEPFLRAWEMYYDLTENLGTIQFSFDRSEMIDRDPPKNRERQFIEMSGMSEVNFTGRAMVSLLRITYPDPPVGFISTSNVEAGYRRWIQYREGKEPLQSMAYFVLTLLEDAANGRRQATSTFQIDSAILTNMGRLTSTRGDPITARKAAGATVDLTKNEIRWLEEAARRVIYRIGEHASGHALRYIQLSDLPML